MDSFAYATVYNVFSCIIHSYVLLCAQVEEDVRLEDDWVPMDEQLSALELEEVLREKGAHSSAVVLESVSILHNIWFSSPT